LSTSSGNEQVRNISQFTVHPDYYGNLVGYDIGVVKAEKPFTLNKWVNIISLPPKDFIHWSFLKVFGWGSVNPRMETPSEILQKTYLYLIPFESCEEVLMLAYGEIPLHETELCAGNLDGSTDTCRYVSEYMEELNKL
jgi:hypothetical protein